jgi:hypothetical protein
MTGSAAAGGALKPGPGVDAMGAWGMATWALVGPEEGAGLATGAGAAGCTGAAVGAGAPPGRQAVGGAEDNLVADVARSCDAVTGRGRDGSVC